MNFIDNIKTFIRKNMIAFAVSILALLIYGITIWWGGRLCDCTSTEKEASTGSHRAHGFYYHK